MRFVRSCVFSAFLVIGLAANTAASPVAERSQAKTVLRVAIPGDERNWTPYTYQSGYPGYNILTLMYDTLLWHDKNNSVIPWLASGFTFGEAGRTINLDLRSDVVWHDGKPLTADDVKFTYEYVRDVTHGRFSPEVKRTLDSVTVDSPTRVTFRLKQPSAFFPAIVLADVPILPRHIWEPIREPYPARGKSLEGLAIGSGPYRMTAYTPDNGYQLVANDAYFIGRPAIDEVQLRILPETNAQLLALRAGDVDVIAPRVPPELVTQFEQTDGIKVATGADFTTIQMDMNTVRPPFDQVKFRQAVGFAIDVNELVRSVMAGYAVPGSPGFVHPESVFYKAGLTHEYNVGRANSLLDELGYTGRTGDGVRQSAAGKDLAFDIIVASSDAIRVRTAELVSAMLGKVGIKATVLPLTSAAITQRTSITLTPDKRDFDLFVWSISASYQDDPNRLRDLYETKGSLEVAGFSNPTFDAVALEQGQAIDAVARKAAVARMQDILAEQRPTVVLFYPKGAYAYRTAAYTNWQYVKGKGIFDKISLVQRAGDGTEAAPAPPSPARSDGDGGTALVAIGGAVVLVGIAGLVMVRRRRAEQQE